MSLRTSARLIPPSYSARVYSPNNSNAENILAKFTGEEVFPSDFAIYDLSQFLSGISLFNDPQLEFTSSDFVSIRGGRQSAKYYFSDPEITLKSAPEKM
ncbi:MAG: hypothetical protein CM15mV3_1340 [Caudoviricetes sp.]|nr:MAG: hypothetical protein CM15mV3_1340 [Caudoviricetes sp.]